MQAATSPCGVMNTCRSSLANPVSSLRFGQRSADAPRDRLLRRWRGHAACAEPAGHEPAVRAAAHEPRPAEGERAAAAGERSDVARQPHRARGVR